MSRYLIIKIGGLGDVVMCLAALRALRRSPGCKITWITGRKAAPLLELSAMVDEIITVDEDALLGRNRTRAAREVFSVWRRLAGRAFDTCLIPYRDWRYNLLRLTARCGTVRSFRDKRALIPGRYHGGEYHRLALGEEVPSGEVAYPNLAESRGAGTEVPDILLAPGGAFNAAANDTMRRWPVSSYVRFARLALDKNLRVGLIGSGNDEELEPSFAGLPVVSYINKTNLGELLGLLGNTRLLVTHDCGAMHLMKLAGGAMIALFGPTLASEKILPSEKVVALRAPGYLPCRPCYNGKTYAVCHNNLCMTRILPEQVFDRAIALLERNPFAAGRPPGEDFSSPATLSA